MRKLVLVSALAASIAAMVPASAMAQSYGDVRQDQRDMRHDRRDMRDAQARGDWRSARDARQDMRDDRQDARQDWRGYRTSHPDVYRGPAYVGPRAGWRYRPVSVGYRFDPVFYGQRYWVDPGRYHLPVAPAYHRYVRYGNDVVLVNVRSGRVMNVYGGFFI